MTYKFPENNPELDLNKIKSEEKELDDTEKSLSKTMVKDSTIGGLFDLSAFNKQADKITDITRKKKKLKDKIKLSRYKKREKSYGNYTINQFIDGIIQDTFDMIIDLNSLRRINFYSILKILRKNFRILTILIFLLLVLFCSYIIINYLV
jgi:hypothetical protein